MDGDQTWTLGHGGHGRASQDQRRMAERREGERDEGVEVRM